MRRRRTLWVWATVIGSALVLFAVAGYLGAADAGQIAGLQQFSEASHDWLERYGVLLHVTTHGLTYICLLVFWPYLIAWVNRRRRARLLSVLSTEERRAMARWVIVLCVTYEAVSWSQMVV